MEELILERKAGQIVHDDGDKSDSEDNVECSRTLEGKIEILRNADEVAVEAGHHKLSRYLQELSNSLLITRSCSGPSTDRESGV